MLTALITGTCIYNDDLPHGLHKAFRGAERHRTGMLLRSRTPCMSEDLVYIPGKHKSEHFLSLKYVLQ